MQNQGQSRAHKNTFSTLTGNQQAFSNQANGDGLLKGLDSLPMDYGNMSQLNYFPYSFQLTLPSMNTATMIQQQFMPINDLYTQEVYTRFAFRGMRAICEIDKLLLNNYYPIKEQIFNKCNSNSAKRMDATNNKIDWFKGRVRYQFKDGIARGILFILESVNNIYQGKQEAHEKMKIDINLNDPELGEFIKLEKQMEKKAKPVPYQSMSDVIQVISRIVEAYINDQLYNQQ